MDPISGKNYLTTADSDDQGSQEPNTPPRAVLSPRSSTDYAQFGLGRTVGERGGTGQPGSQRDLDYQVSRPHPPFPNPGSDSEATEVYYLSSQTEIYSQASSGSTQSLAPLVPDILGVWSQIRLYREAHLSDPGLCFEWCMRVGLVRPTPSCYRHRVPRTLSFRTDRPLPTWCCQGCRDRVSSSYGSIFEGARIPVGQILVLAWSYAHCSTYEETRLACTFSRDDVGPANSTISSWFGYFRDRMIDAAENLRVQGAQIGGPGMVVQIDEALIGRRKYHRGRVVPGTWVVGMIADDGRLQLEICARRDAATLHRIIRRNVRTGSIIHTDGWRAYQGLEAYGYSHQVVNHNLEFVAPDGTHTQRIEAQWRALRRRFAAGGIRHEDIGDHLIEYIWRRDCKARGRDPFASLISFLSYN